MYLLKVVNKSTRKSCEICSMLIIVLVFLSLTLDIFYTFSRFSVNDFEQENAHGAKRSPTKLNLMEGENIF